MFVQERVTDLQKYVEVLKSEKDDLQANDSSAQHSLSTGSNVRRVGGSCFSNFTTDVSALKPKRREVSKT